MTRPHSNSSEADRPEKEPKERADRERPEREPSLRGPTPLETKDMSRTDRAGGCEPGFDEELIDLFERAKREGLDRESLGRELKNFFKLNDRSQLQLNEEQGIRCGDWYSMDDLGSRDYPAGHSNFERFAQLMKGLGDLGGQFVEMQVQTRTGHGYVGQDHYYHCLGHCQSASQGWGGQLASKIVGRTRESGDAKKNVGRSGAKHAIFDSFVDTYVNRFGFLGGARGTRCSDHCARLKPKGMR
jgi:Serum amyloid A protein